MLTAGPLFIGIMAIAIAAVGAIGVLSGKHVSTSRDFAVGGQSAGVLLLVGILMGIVGGAATIGTAQMAFEYGLSGWWFTLGGGIACLIMGLFYAEPLRESGAETIPEFIGNTYGAAARAIIGIAVVVAMFIQVFGQVLSSMALLSATFGMNSSFAILISVGLMIVYVFFGGAWGAGLIGLLKAVLICFSLAVGGFTALRLSGGISGLHNSFPPYPWLSLFGRGLSKDIAAALSVVVGLLSTQTYLQAMFTGKDVATCKKAAFISAVLIPPTGLACVLIGMYMRSSCPTMDSSHVLPAFFLNHTHPIVGGLAIASLLIAVVGTGAGITLSMSLMISKDVYGHLINRNAEDRRILAVSRLSVVVILLLSVFFVQSNAKTLFLSWTYLSMGLRGSAVFLPVVTTMILKERPPSWVGAVAGAAGPLAILLGRVFIPNGPDPLYMGVGVSALVLFMGVIVSRKNGDHKEPIVQNTLD